MFKFCSFNEQTLYIAQPCTESRGTEQRVNSGRTEGSFKEEMVFEMAFNTYESTEWRLLGRVFLSEGAPGPKACGRLEGCQVLWYVLSDQHISKKAVISGRWVMRNSHFLRYTFLHI